MQAAVHTFGPDWVGRQEKAKGLVRELDMRRDQGMGQRQGRESQQDQVDHGYMRNKWMETWKEDILCKEYRDISIIKHQEKKKKVGMYVFCSKKFQSWHQNELFHFRV